MGMTRQLAGQMLLAMGFNPWLKGKSYHFGEIFAF
jgi:hypothetical protein